MTKESAADIVKYLDIVDGKLPTDPLKEGDEIHLGINTQGAMIGDQYLFDNGIRWMKITEESNQHWLIEYGLIEHDAENKQYISKQDLSSMIHSGELILHETDDQEDILTESLVSNDHEFEEFMDKVDRYLLVNHMMESQDFDYAWRISWAEGRLPSEACEEAVLLED